MSYLWDKPKNDPDWLMHEELRDRISSGFEDQGDDPVAEVFDAICRVYYDVFNNGGCNLPDVTWLAVCIMSIQEYCKRKKIDCPTFVGFDEDYPEDGYDLITTDTMDAFARIIIRHLYLDETTNA